MTVKTQVRMGVDIGGTFTDGVLEVGSRRWSAKVLTHVTSPEEGIFDVMQVLLKQAGCRPQDIDLIVHGTTLATNALIERAGAVTALVTTEGHRDVIEVRDENRFDIYDSDIEMPQPLIARNLRFGVTERMSAQGKVLAGLDENALREVARQCRDAHIEAVAICFLHSYVNDAHERRAREVLQQELPGVRISISSEVSPQMREYERFLTTCANAYIQPKMDAYLSRLEQRLGREGFHCPALLILSSGALTTIETSRRFPVRLVESGPAGGAVFAANIARDMGIEQAIAFDMGGTTAKLCLIDDYTPARGGTFEVARAYKHKAGSGWPIKIPVIDLVEIGAGGGSIASIDALGRLAVGPQSAGSTPGPVCYGRGGSKPTVTDANLAVSLLSADYFAGGTVALDAQASRHSIGQTLRPIFGDDSESAALGIREIVGENMAQAARIHAIERGKLVSQRCMIAFGGCAPLHACHLANKLGIDQVIIPSGAGVGSAIGFLQAPVAYELIRSFKVALDGVVLEDINAMLQEMSARAREVVVGAIQGGAFFEQRQAFMRYVGQGYEIPVAVPDRLLDASDMVAIRRAFEDEYARLYSRTVPSAGIEIVTWSVLVSESLGSRMQVMQVPVDGPSHVAAQRRIHTEHGAETASVHHRQSIAPGQQIDGPALIVEAETTFFVAREFRACITPLGHIQADRKQP